MAVFLPTAEKRTTRGKAGAAPRRGDAPSRIVIHTTETNVLPGYRSGGSAPHFTIGVGDPGSLTGEPLGAVRVWQHVSLDRTAYALRHPRGTIETNHMGAHCVQIECVTYVGDQPAHGIVGNRGKFPAPLFEALAGLVREIVSTIDGVDLSQFPDTWSATGSSGERAPQRMSASEWEAFGGICGHQHVPHNSHWDPGEFDIKRFVASVSGGSAGSGAVSSPEPAPAMSPDWPMLLELGDRDGRVAVIRGVLQTLGYGNLGDSDVFNDKVDAVVRKLQRKERVVVDGIWGPRTHSAARARLDEELRR